MSLDDELADDAPKIHLVLEADEGRAAWKPAHPVNRRRARRLQNRVGEKRVERPDGIDVNRRDVGPVGVEPGEPRLHDAHDVDVSPWRTIPWTPTPRSRISPAPATTNVGRGVAPGIV